MKAIGWAVLLTVITGVLGAWGFLFLAPITLEPGDRIHPLSFLGLPLLLSIIALSQLVADPWLAWFLAGFVQFLCCLLLVAIVKSIVRLIRLRIPKRMRAFLRSDWASGE